MSEAQTIVAIAVPGFVAALTVGSNVYLAHRQSKETRTLADIDAVRSLLDEAAQLFHEIGYAIGDALSKYLQHGESFFDAPENGAEAYREIETLGKECDRMVVRLQIRLGSEHPAAKRFKEANGAVLEIFRKLGRGKRAAERDVGGDLWEAMSIDRTLFQDRADKFVKAAHKAAGAQLLAD